MDVNHRLLVFKRHVGQTPTIGRPGRRNDRLFGTQSHFCVLPVSVGNVQLITIRTAFDHISNTRRKNSRLTYQLFVNHVGNAMARSTQHRRGCDKSVTGQRRLLVHIIKPEAGFLSVIADRRKATSRQRVCSPASPVAIIWRRRFGHRHATSVDHLEQAATLQITSDHRANCSRTTWITAEISNRHRNSISASASNLDGQLGTGRCLKQGQRTECDQAQDAQFEQRSNHWARTSIK